MYYTEGSNYEFEVSKSYGEDEAFFRIIVPDYGEVHLKKLKFQQEGPLPDKLRCRIKSNKNNIIILSHYVPDYVNRFYSDSAKKEEVHEFSVILAPKTPGDPYILEDDHGIRFNLSSDNVFLSPGQKALCRFDRITDNYFSIKTLGSQLMPPFYHSQAFLDKIGVRGMKAKVVLNMLKTYLTDAYKELEQGSSFWVMTAIKDAAPKLTEWFLSPDFRHRKFFRKLLNWLKRAALYVLEDSRYLRNIDIMRRRDYQKRLTEIVDSLDPVNEALKILDFDRERRYVENITEKLSQSGNLYHPSERLSTLMLLMRRNPSLVRTYLGGIFDAIMGWRLDTWTTEPFRSAFIDQFEIYIRQASSEIDMSPQAETGSDNDRIEKIITAIALQLLISGDPDSERSRLNRSRFYRYASLQRPLKGELLLDKAFRALMGAKIPIEFNYNNIRQPQAVMTCATYLGPEGLPQIDIPHRYKYGEVEFTVTGENCILRRSDEKSPGRTLPNGLMNWLSPQIFLEDFQSLNGNQINSFDAHKRMWANIEKSLFDKKDEKLAARERTKIEIDEEALVIISPEPIERGDNPRWMVRIVDDNYVTENGYINRDDIVGYKITSTNLDHDREVMSDVFLDEKGKPRQFYAKLIDVDENDELHFSLSQEVANCLPDNMNDYDIYRAVIAVTNGNSYSAIAETGYGLVLKSPDNVKYKNGDIVNFRLNNRNNPSYLQGTILGLSENVEFLNKTMGFANLLKSISVPVESDDSEIEEFMPDLDENLTAQEMAELIELIRFKAISSDTLLEAYDYLNFARLLARMIEDTNLADKLAVHAHLLHLHQFYAKNLRVDREELELHRAEVAGYPLLEMVFHRLELVSWLGNTERNADLWATISNDRNHLETTLAQLVLSYNMLPATNHEDSIADNLKKRIAHTLGLNYEARQLKNYGNENLFTEFKSSLVYPAGGRKDKVEPDPVAQQKVILKTIAAFMNSDGGTLYLGVNDKTHCEIGLFEDFEYYKHNYPSDGKIVHKIVNADNMCNFLTNLVCNTWGNVVGGSVKIDTDPEASHDVIIINVEPRTTPVVLDGIYYVRRSGTSKKLSEREVADFIEERKSLERLKLEDQEVLAKSTAAPAEEPRVAEQAEIPATDAPETSNILESPEEEDSQNKVATSTWRPNALHSWDDGYVEPAGYLNFKTHSLILTDEDRQADFNDDYTRVLAFTSREAEQEFLIMVFANQRVLKVPMTEVVQRERDAEIKFYDGARLMFVSIARNSDSLLSHLSDAKGNLSRRVVPISEIETQHLSSAPVAIANVSGASTCEACEIVPAKHIGSFSGSTTADLSSRQLGYLLRCGVGSEKARQIFEEDCKKCRP